MYIFYTYIDLYNCRRSSSSSPPFEINTILLLCQKVTPLKIEFFSFHCKTFKIKSNCKEKYWEMGKNGRSNNTALKFKKNTTNQNTTEKFQEKYDEY